MEATRLVRSGVECVLQWEKKDNLDAARKVLEAEGPESWQLEHLAHWFKHTFFTFVHKVPCNNCGSNDTTMAGAARPNLLEQSGGANRVEVHSCSSCGAYTRFPRYNAPQVLLTTRRGRCGEASNLAGQLLRAAGFDVRHVAAVEDHVWIEARENSATRFVHFDPCENAIGKPLMYERGWGKRFTYIIAASKTHVADVTKSYCKAWNDETLHRRRKNVTGALCALLVMQSNALLAKLPMQAREAQLGTILSECYDSSKEKVHTD